MNPVFVDTSAILALLVASDEAHERAKLGFAHLSQQQSRLVTSSYVLVETYALLGRRFGREAVRSFRESLVPLFVIVWVDEAIHERGLELLLASEFRGLSLVDAVSFVTARDHGAQHVFAFDRHFALAGFSFVG